MQHKFHKIYIELTNICGLECSFCPTKDTQTPKTIPLQRFKNLIEQIKPFTKVIALHIFGDPLTLKNLKDYINVISKSNLKVEITTTGFFLKKHSLDLFLEPSIRQVNFSLNSFAKNEPKITIDEYLEPIFALCDLKLEKKIHNFINLRLWNQDENNSEEEFNSLVFKKLFNKFKVKIENKTYSQPIRLENQILLHFDNYFEWPSLQNKHLSHGFCHGLSAQLGILSDGTVVPCCLDGFGVINLGNILEIPLVEILNSTRANNIIKGFQDKIAVEELCQKCSFKDRFL